MSAGGNYGFNTIWVNRNNNIFDNLDFKPINEIKNLKDINNRELITVIPIALIVLLFGVYPAPLVNLISPAIDSLIQLIQFNL